ncbi:ABC transporter permease [Pseudooceanicola nanhaiensis]|uniref:ABC transporter permease n=1 Tax=Pseudooceanicola nanhaiensis TaxID=375761 RepID=UPI001CD43C29|nr:ABC transporter permease [Pseudooceanicola nanhaiensis]MCA0921418.1 ABC transporter permease [Pseudooceanicola nanhaiensis]
MLTYVLKRCLMGAPTVLLVAVLVFTLIRAIPGDPAQIMLADQATTETLAAMRTELGLDQPVPVQFALWLGKAVQGDFGVSIRTGQEVLPTVMERFRVTASVVFLAMAVAGIVAIPAGLIAARFQNRTPDMAVTLLAIFTLSLPSFWVGLMLLLTFGVWLGWLPTIGYVSVLEDFGRGVLYLLMPVGALALTEIGVLTRMMRSSALEVLRMEYVTHARAKGLGEVAVLWRHVLRNAAGPTLTMAGLSLAALLGGATVIETVFSLPGTGKLIVDSIYARDYPVLQCALLIVALVYVVVNLLVDILYSLIDPRVRLK